jgi:hypothetical protein
MSCPRNSARQSDCGYRIISVIGIDHQTHVRPEGFTYDADQLRVALHAESDLHLGRAESTPQIELGFAFELALERLGAAEVESGRIAGDRLCLGRAEHAVERQSRGLRLDVPTGDVEGAERGEHQPLLAVVDATREQHMP